MQNMLWDSWLAIVVILTVVFAVVGAAWVRRGSAWLKAAASLLVIVCLLGVQVAIFGNLGQPYPVSFDLLGRDKKAVVIAYHLEEKEAIYYWLLPEGARQPFFIKRPWSDQEADQVVKGSRAVAGSGGELLYEPSLESRDPPHIYPAPQKAPPPKDVAPGEAERFTPPAAAANGI